MPYHSGYPFLFCAFDQVPFSDFAGYLITIDASLDALNGELSNPISMERFRANIIISGPKAFEEVWGFGLFNIESNTGININLLNLINFIANTRAIDY